MKELAAFTGVERKHAVRGYLWRAWLAAFGSILSLSFITVEAADPPSLVGLAESSEQLEYRVIRQLIDAELFELAVARCRRLLAEAPSDSVRRARRQAWLLEATVERDAPNATTIADALKPAESCSVICSPPPAHD